MILDGYNRTAAIGNGDSFTYRPLTRLDRQRLEHELRDLPDLLAEKWERQIVEAQIVVADWDCAVRDMDDETYRTVATLVLGYGNDEQEIADETNLSQFVELRERYPWLANTSCASCRKWLYDPVAGKLFQNKNDDGDDEPIPRPAGYPLLCEGGTCPKGHWSNPVELSAKNTLALQHYETTAGATDDPLVGRNRKIISDALDRARADAGVDGRAKGGGVAADQPRRVPGGRTGDRRTGGAGAGRVSRRNVVAGAGAGGGRRRGAAAGRVTGPGTAGIACRARAWWRRLRGRDGRAGE